MKRIGIVGGTGFTGTHLSQLLQKNGYHVVIFTRNIEGKKNTPYLTYAEWNTNGKSDTEALSKIDVAVNLAGAGIADKRWTEERKKEILDSRVQSSRYLIAQLKQHGSKCTTYIAASATGFYGRDKAPDQPFTEDMPVAPDFLGQSCAAWEAESTKAETFLRTVILRFGIVLGKESGAYPQLAAPMNFGIMPILGGGQQMVSWISVEDIAAMIQFAIEKTNLAGIYNAVAPNPVTHKALMKTIARVKGGIKIPAPAPAFLLKIMLGEMSEEVLKSCNVSARKILAAGFKFNYPDIYGAIKAIA